MPRSLWRWDKNTQEFVEIGARDTTGRHKTPTVITDEIPPTPSPINGEMFTSAAKLRRQIKANGYELRDGAKSVASDPTPNPEMSDDAYHRDVERAVNMVRYGTAPLSEYDKARCAIINRQIKNRA